jgi:phosphoesterase RecJ-like protein
MMYGGRSLESKLLLGRLLARSEGLAGNRIIYTYETLEEKEAFGAENRDSDTLYQSLQGVKGCEAVVLIREEAPGECSVGTPGEQRIGCRRNRQDLRRRGHRKAAGFTFYGKRDDIKRVVLEVLQEKLKNTDD